MVENDFKVEKLDAEDIPTIQVIVLTDDHGVSYEYYGAPFMDHVPRIKSMFVGPIVHKDEVIDYLENSSFGSGMEGGARTTAH